MRNKLVSGVNDLKTKYPLIAEEWDYEKNGSALPENYLPGSEKCFFWICQICHASYQAIISNRVRGQGCPYCSGRQAVTGVNDLLTLRPDVAEEWDYEKNGEIRPELLTVASSKKPWWKCLLCGYSWQASICNRTTQNTGCPNCWKYRKTSFSEQSVFFYVQKMFPDAVNGYTDIFNNRMELDVYIPSIKTGIEYDGVHWHTNIKKDHEKYSICKAHGIKLIRIIEYYSGKSFNEAACDILIKRSSSGDAGLNYCIKELLMVLCDNKLTVDVEADRSLIKTRYIVSFKSNSLATKYPDLAAEWDQERNGGLTPSMVTPNSGDKVWWKCPTCGQSYYMTPDRRVGRGAGCPYCSGRKAIPGVNDFTIEHPKIAAEWNYEKNKGLIPSSFKSGSDKYVWWKCKKEHEWQERIYKRTLRKYGCPYCSGQRIIPGETDFKSLFPEIAKEWNYQKNDFDPSFYSPHSDQKVWWICSKGHEWEATISSRTGRQKTGCPFCSGKKVLVGFNDLMHLRPDIAAEWNYQKNIELKPSQVTLHSNKKVWWICPNGHEWKAKINHRIHGTSCPFCCKDKISGVLNPMSKVVLKYTLQGEYVCSFPSVAEAARSINMKANGSNISQVCQHKRTQAYGYVWRYKGDEVNDKTI